MPRSARAFLEEMERAVTYLLARAEFEDLASYTVNETIQFAVERNFITIGEAMAQMRRDFPLVAARIPNASKIVAFRNLIIHQYWNIDSDEVWSNLVSRVKPLHAVLIELLADITVL